MSKRIKIKTEHAGAKNGGGYWGKRTEAKERSSSLRRRADAEVVVHELAMDSPEAHMDQDIADSTGWSEHASIAEQLPCPCRTCTPDPEPPACEPAERWCEVTVWGD